MALPSARIHLAVAPPNAVFTIAGRAAVERSRDFKAAVENLATTGVQDIYVDVTQCLLMDSMFSGVLANLAKSAGPRFTLFNANERILELLANLGALKFFRLSRSDEAPPSAGESQAIASLPEDKRATAECCLEAHRFLMRLKEENQAKFATLEKYLEAEIRAMPPTDPKAPSSPTPSA